MGWKGSLLHRAALAALLSAVSLACMGFTGGRGAHALRMAVGQGSSWTGATPAAPAERGAPGGFARSVREPSPVEVEPPSLGFPLPSLEEGFAPVSLSPARLLDESALGLLGAMMVSAPDAVWRYPRIEEEWSPIWPARRPQPVRVEAPRVADLETCELRLVRPTLVAPLPAPPPVSPGSGVPAGHAPRPSRGMGLAIV